MADAGLFGEWPDLVTDMVAGNDAVGEIPAATGPSLVTGDGPSRRFPGDQGITIPHIPLYEQGDDFAASIYAQADPADGLEPGQNSILACKDDGTVRYPGAWCIEQYMRSDGSRWLRGYVRNRNGSAQWIGSSEGVAPFEGGMLITLRQITDVASLYVGSELVVSQPVTVGPTENKSNIEIGWYREGVSPFTGWLQLLSLYVGTISADALAEAPPAQTIDVSEPEPEAPEPPAETGSECALRSSGTLVTKYRDWGLTRAQLRLDRKGNSRYDFSDTWADSQWDGKNGTPSLNVVVSAAQDGGCMFGLTVTNGYGRDRTQERQYPSNHGGQIYLRDNPCKNFTICSCRMDHNWDPIRLGYKKGLKAEDFANVGVRSCWISNTYDDVIENDNWRDGNWFHDCLIEEAYVFYSCRNSGGEEKHDKRKATITDCLIGLGEMYPRGGSAAPVMQFFKLDGKSISFDVTNCTFYAPRRSDVQNGDPFFDLRDRSRLERSERNTLVLGPDWSGDYDYGDLPGFTVTEDADLWHARRAAWIDAHPWVPRL